MTNIFSLKKEKKKVSRKMSEINPYNPNFEDLKAKRQRLSRKIKELKKLRKK